MLSNISDLFTMASLVICMLLSGIIFYYLRTRISMLEQSVMDQAQLLQQVVTSLKSSQYRQVGGPANMNSNSDVVDSNVSSNIEKPMNLIQVSDDSDESDNDSDDTDDTDDTDGDDDDSQSETGQCADVNMDVCTMSDSGNCLSKIIDLSAITSSNSFKPYSPSQSEIKVIELKSNIHSNRSGDGNHDHDSDGDDDVTNSSDDDEDDDNEDEYDEDEYSEDDDEAVANQMKKDGMSMNENKECVENQIQIQNGDHDGGNKKMKSIVIEDVSNFVSLDEMKNMPVNSLRILAKTKLSNLDVPTINRMSKKEILKALHE